MFKKRRTDDRFKENKKAKVVRLKRKTRNRGEC